MAEVTTSLSRVMKVGSIDETRGGSCVIPAVAKPGAGALRHESRDPEAAAIHYLAHAKELEEDAKRRLEEVQAQASQMLEEAQSAAKDMYARERERGYQDGFDSGYKESIQSAQTTCEAMVERASALVSEADSYRHHLIRSLSQPLTNIAMLAVKRILERELVLDGPNIATVVDSLLQFVTEGTRAEVRVHPEDYAAAVAAHPVWQSKKLGAWSVAVVPDADLERGDCEIISDVGHVDARMETKLTTLRTAVLEFMERREKEFVEGLDSGV